MDLSQIVPLAGQFGPLGLLVWYLVWRESAERKDRRELAQARLELDKNEILSRVDLSKSLTMLAMVIQGKPDV